MFKNWQKYILLLICFLFGLSLALQIKTANIKALTGDDIEELRKNIVSYSEKNAELNARNIDLYSRLEELENDRNRGDLAYQTISDECERIARFAGLRPVENSGISLTIRSSHTSSFVIQLFVNELNALGAQAIAINDQRRVASSEIRMTNENIIVNGKAFPRQELFVIQAITPPDQEDYNLASLKGLSDSLFTDDPDNDYEISVQAEEKVRIPALSEDSVALALDLLKPANDKEEQKTD